MALNLQNKYPGRFDPVSADYPQGKFKNRSSPTAQDGSYMERDWLNDWNAFFGALLANAGVSPNGNVDTAQSSQLYNALIGGIVKTAGRRDVGIGAGQIPDMSYFQSVMQPSGRILLPGGYMRQWGSAIANGIGDFSITYNVAFAAKPFFIGFGYRQSSTPISVQSIIVNDTTNGNTGFSGRAYEILGGSSGAVTPSTNAFYWVAEGIV